MDRARQLESVAADAATIATRTAAEPVRPVPACPDWTRADLRAQVGGFARLVPTLLAGTASSGSPSGVSPEGAAARRGPVAGGGG